MKNNTLFLGKLLYAITFLILVPAGLWLWAIYTEEMILLPKIESHWVGGVLMTIGVGLILWAMFALKYYGKGLPMNAYPPVQFVTKGPYSLFHHPIYIGFGLLILGVFIYKGSASGFWMVTPLTLLAMSALVIGYEEIDLKRRFPESRNLTLLDFPEDNHLAAKLRDRASSLFWIIILLVTSNLIINLANAASNAENSFHFTFFKDQIYSSHPFLNLIFILVFPFLIKQKEVLREWIISIMLALFYMVFITLLYPVIGAQYIQSEDSLLLTTPLFLIFISVKAMFRQSRITGFILALVAMLLVSYQMVNSLSALPDLTVTILIFLLSAFYKKIWKFLKNGSEKIANSWKEWVFGKVRIINHGFYVGFGAFLGILLAGILAGKEYALALLIFSFLVTVFSALWAQLIEGSEKLKRPFGFYGGLVGILFGSLTVWGMGYNCWVIIGVASVVMPWVQAIGRLRCLVNGCCHGGLINDPLIGIRYYHPRSRVCNISGMKGELVHPTQLYSIIWLFFVGIFLITLWQKGPISISLIFGLYLILTNIGRFAEEAYRGESQTPSIRRLRLYQWTAVVSVVVGILMTLIRIPAPSISPGFSWESFVVALISGLFIFFAMGVDFPYSNKRFSRLV